MKGERENCWLVYKKGERDWFYWLLLNRLLLLIESLIDWIIGRLIVDKHWILFGQTDRHLSGYSRGDKSTNNSTIHHQQQHTNKIYHQRQKITTFINSRKQQHHSSTSITSNINSNTCYLFNLSATPISYLYLDRRLTLEKIMPRRTDRLLIVYYRLTNNYWRL